MSKIIPLETLHTKLDEMLVDIKYDLDRARSPKSKRHKKTVLDFFTSIKHHLNAEKNDNNS